MDERRNDGIGVELHVRGVKLVPAQRHQVLLSFEFLLGQRQSHLLGANRIDAVIEFEHFALADVLISLTAVIAAAPPSSAMNARLFHSITSSARASSAGGTVRPSAFAVLRLMLSSYLVGACTGRSAGFSPLRMRST